MSLLERLLLTIEAQGGQAVNEIGRITGALRGADAAQNQLRGNLISGLAAGAGYAGVQGAAQALQKLGQFAIESANAAAEDARSQTVLATTMRNSADATRDQINAAEDYISAAQRATTITDDDLRQALATLTVTTKDSEQALTLLMIAQDVSAGTGRSLVTVSEALAKAYSGQTTALTRLVPETSAFVREGDSMNEIFAQLATHYGGIAKQTGAVDVMARLNIETNELKENVGGGLLPEIKQLNTALAELNGTPIPQVFNAVLNPASGFAATLGAGGKSIREIAGAQTQATETTSEMINRILKLTPVVTNLGTESKIAANGLDTLSKAADDAIASALGLGSAQSDYEDALSSVYDTGAKVSKQQVDLIALDFDRAESARSVAQAQQSVADAEKNLADIRKGATADELASTELAIESARQAKLHADLDVENAQKEQARLKGLRGTDPQAQAAANLAVEDALVKQKEAQDALKRAEDEHNKTQQKGKEGSDDLAEATTRVEDAQWSLKEALEQQRRAAEQDQADGGAVGRSAKQQRTNFLQAASAAKDVIQAMIDAGEPADIINGKVSVFREQLEKAGLAAGATKQEIKDVADVLQALAVIAQAQQERQQAGIFGFDVDTSLGPYLDALRKRGVYVPDVAYALARGESRDSGGPGYAGTSYQIGTKEYFKPAVNGNFELPLGGAQSSGGGVHIENLHVSAWDKSQAPKIAEIIMMEINRLQRASR